MLAIFDLDGTLLNSLEDLCSSTNHVLSKYGYPEHPLEAYKMFVGNGIRKLAERALPEYARREDIIGPFYEELLAYYSEHKMDTTRPYDGIVESLEYLQSMGVRLGVASNKAHAAMAPLMEHYFPTIRFVAALGNKPGAAPKPDPSIVLEIIEMAGETAETTLYFGDSGVDMQTALNAGLRKVGVLWGFRSREELVSAGADILMEVPNPMAFERVFKRAFRRADIWG